MHQSFETPAPPPPPHSGLSGGLRGLSPHIHSILVSPVGGEFAGSHGLRIPLSGAVTPWSIIFAPHSNFAHIIVALQTRPWIPVNFFTFCKAY